MKNYCRRFIILIGLLLVCSLNAGELTINSYVDRTTIGLDDQLRFTIEITGTDAGKISQPELPEISGFRNIGSSSSSSSSFSIVGGRMTGTVTRSFVYTLRPVSAGNFLIPPISLQFEKQTLVTDPIRISVVEGTVQPPPVSRQFREQAPEPEQLAENIFIVAETAKTSVVRGEPVVVNYLLYSRYDLANLSFVNEPNFVGFWKDDVFFANRMNFRRTTHQGRSFNVMTLRTVVLYPNRSGSLTIPALEINADLIIRPRTFFDFDSTRKHNIAGKPVTLEVRDLPAAGRPENFTGAVGSYRISSRISETSLTVGDTFTYTLQISGNGNFKHFNPPPFPKLRSFRFIDPETATDTKVDGSRVTGTKTIRYPVIVHEEGDFTIPPLTFAFFDPQRNSYQLLETESYSISVAPSDLRAIPHTVAQSDVLSEGADIYYIYRTANLHNIFFIVNSPLYWFAWLVLLLTIPLALYYRKEKERLSADTNYFRLKQARRILHKYLHRATSAARQGDMDFYSFVNTGLSNYLTDNLKIPRGSTNDRIYAEMKANSYPEETIGKVKTIINRCLEARFKPGGFDRQKIEKDYEEIKETVALLSKLKKSNKENRRNGMKR